MQTQTKRYGKPYYQTQEIQNTQFTNSVVPSESTISLNSPYGIENFDALLGTEEYADQMLGSLKKQDIYQTAAVDYQEVYNNDGQYINLQRRRLMPDLTVSQSQIMEQANRLNQSNIQTRDQRRFKTGNHITQSTAVQNIMQRAGETGQLLPTITPFDGVQQDPQGYDGIVNTSFTPKVPLNENISTNENFVKVANYQDKTRYQKEQFQYIKTPTQSQSQSQSPSQSQQEQQQNFDSTGQVAELLTLFPDYKVKLTPSMQANLISILNVLIENPAAYSEVKKSTEYQMMPLMYKFNLYRAKSILAARQ